MARHIDTLTIKELSRWQSGYRKSLKKGRVASCKCGKAFANKFGLMDREAIEYLLGLKL